MSLLNKDNILNTLRDAKEPLTKAQLAATLNVKGSEQRVMMKRMLRELEKDGALEKVGSRFKLADRLPSVTVLEITEIDIDGDVFAEPYPWEESQGPKPRIEMRLPKHGAATYAMGERVLAKITHIEDDLYAGEAIKRLSAAHNRVMGTLVKTKKGLLLSPVDKKARYDYIVIEGEDGGAELGDIVLGEVMPQQQKELMREVRIVEIIGKADNPKIISLISIHECGLRHVFPDAAIAETKDMKVPPLEKREDLRQLPLVTIDGADARDFDDAVYAESDPSPSNKGGFHLIVAIADVSYYVRPGSALDQEAYLRGNSTYFPDRVVPMLPEAISNDLCSLRPHEERAAVAIHLWIDAQGEMIRYKPVRALIKSAARLTYEQVQAAKDGVTDSVTEGLMEKVINPLYAAFSILDKARQRRGALELDLPERKILMNDKNEMTGVTQRIRLDAHKLIEEFMILANVAAARALEDKKASCIYRVHDRPDANKLQTVREFVEGFGINFAIGQVVKPMHINGLLNKAKEGDGMSQLISQIVLRAQSQAIYSKENNGHFGLALSHYAHFTSPIRRYADLIVHRSMVAAYGFGEGGLSDGEEARLAEIADFISQTERKSMEAERGSVDRFTAAYLSDKVGAEFAGRISGVTRFGLFVTLDENGADGIIPMRSMKDDFYIHDEEQHALIGRRTRKVFRLCAPIRVRLVEADGMTGSTVLEVVGNEGADIPGFKPKKTHYSNKTPPKPANKGRQDRRYNKGGAEKSGEVEKSGFKPRFAKPKKKTTPKHKRKKPNNPL